MIRRRQTRAAVETLWAMMVEHAEAANELAVLGQRAAEIVVAGQIAQRANALAAIAHAIIILARGDDDAP